MTIRDRLEPRLWLVRTDDVAVLPFEHWLDLGERARLAQIGGPEERRRRVAAWGLRRWALSRACPAVPEADWRFVPGPHGKPELAPAFGARGLHQSLTHGGAYAAVVVAGMPCGVDVEALPDGLEAASVVFGPRERAEIDAHARPAERFLQHWVAKEAVLKCIGTGFGQHPEWLSLDLTADGRMARIRHQATDTLGQRLAIRLWPLPDGHWLAAAVEDGSAHDLTPTMAT